MPSLRSVLQVEELEAKALPGSFLPYPPDIIIGAPSDIAGLSTNSISLQSVSSSRGLISSSLCGFYTNPALQADFHKLTTDTVAEAPTLIADAKALERAIQNAFLTNPAVQNAQAQLQALKAEWKATRAADFLVINAATNDAARNAAIAKKRADYRASQAKIAAAKTVLQHAIANDPGVKAAAAKLGTDSSTIKADLNRIKADMGGIGSPVEILVTSGGVLSLDQPYFEGRDGSPIIDWVTVNNGSNGVSVLSSVGVLNQGATNIGDYNSGNSSTLDQFSVHVLGSSGGPWIAG
jgi:hypothetical protein